MRIADRVLGVVALGAVVAAAITGWLVWNTKDGQLDACFVMLKTSTDAELAARDRVFQLEQQLADATDQLDALQAAVKQ